MASAYDLDRQWYCDFSAIPPKEATEVRGRLAEGPDVRFPVRSASHNVTTRISDLSDCHEGQLSHPP